MKEALRQAFKGLGRTSPNPAVGAVIVRDGEIISSGYHHKAGLPHAEVEALNKLGDRAENSTLYVTLEPCNHHGRTPPCTEAIVKSGIKRVVIGMDDPNPDVEGGGCKFLEEHGVSTTIGVLEKECRRLNEAFLKFITLRRPFVILKSALTIDGLTATNKGHSKWITGKKSRRFVHGLRDRVDAVMVGVGTVLADDPLLTARLSRGRGKDPLRIILDTHLKTPANARILNHDSAADTLIAVGPDVPTEELKKFRKKGVLTLLCPVKSHRIDLNALMDILGEMTITSLLVEGGATIAGSLLREKLIDKFYIFRAPKIFGGSNGIPMATGPGPENMDQCLGLKDTRIRQFEEDILTIGYPDY